VRHCPVKAIKIQNGHAEIVDERCIHDGICIDECPQRAIRVESSIEKVKSFIESGDKVIASLSPFFDSKFDFESPSQIAEGLIHLGFSGVEETITVVFHIVQYYNSFLSNTNSHAISSTCPAIVSLVEKYYPDKIGYLSPVISPSIAHARILKIRHKNRDKERIRVVHIGSCIAMKNEISDDEMSNTFDAALTFEELRRWWRKEGIKIEDFKPSTLGNGYHIIDSKNVLSTIRQASDKLSAKRIRIPELTSSIEFLSTFPNYMRNMQLAHLKGCTEYCPNGLFIATGTNIAKTNRPIICYLKDAYSADDKNEIFYHGFNIDLSREFKTKEISPPMPSEEEIAEILARIGIFNRRTELNCGACGYDSCREKAIAVYQGMAEIEMCMPYMRRQAAHATSIIENSPNAIVLVDADGNIKFTNPGFSSMFRCEGEILLDKPIEDYINSDCFARALHNQGFWAEKGFVPEYDLSYRIQTFPIKEGNFTDTINKDSEAINSTHQLLGGVIVNISEEERSRKEFEKVKLETLQSAQEVIMRQMQTAQEIAGLLGETTADTKVLLTELVNLVRKEELN